MSERTFIRGIEAFVALLMCILFWGVVVYAFDDGLDLPVDPKNMVAPAPQAAPPPPAPLPPIPVAPLPPPAPTIYGHDLVSPNCTVVYVLDTSASMGWDSLQYTTPGGKTATGPRIDRARASLETSIQSLTDRWSFNIITYDCTDTMYRTQLVQATQGAKDAACNWLETCVYLGSATGTGPAVVRSFNTFPDNRLVVLLTDGAPNCGAGDDLGGPRCIAAHRTMISGNNKQRARVDVFGIGATGDFKQFCQDVASDNGGTYTDVR